MPNQPKTPPVIVRVDQPVQEELRLYAEGHDVTLSDVVRHSLERFVATDALPAHSCQHRLYRLTCDEYDELAAAAAGNCQLCGKASDRLYIDHDHALGWSAVRGLVCPKCNSLMGLVDRGDRKPTPPVVAYLAGVWHHGRALRKSNRPPRSERPMKNRIVRVDDETWDAAVAMAQERGENISEVLRQALRDYTRKSRRARKSR